MHTTIKCIKRESQTRLTSLCSSPPCLHHHTQHNETSLRCNAFGLIDPPGRQQVSALSQRVTTLEEKGTEAEAEAEAEGVAMLRAELRVSGTSFEESRRRTAVDLWT